MANTTTDYWSVDGTSLQTLAQNISTLAGGAPPKLRGDDITIPGRPGDTWVPKVAGSRVITFSMWVRGCDENGGVPTGKRPRDQFDDNWQALLALLWRPGEQFTLTKRFRVGGVLKTASALGEFVGGFEPTMIGRAGAKFTVDIKLADPFFYDDAYTTFPLSNGDNTIVLPGTARTENILVTINGSRTQPIIQNKTLGMQVQYFDSLLSGTSVLLDVDSFEATYTPASGPQVPVNGKIRHTGADIWLALKRGTNVINVSSSAGIGTVQLQAKGAWI